MFQKVLLKSMEVNPPLRWAQAGWVIGSTSRLMLWYSAACVWSRSCFEPSVSMADRKRSCSEILKKAVEKLRAMASALHQMDGRREKKSLRWQSGCNDLMVARKQERLSVHKLDVRRAKIIAVVVRKLL